MKNEANATKNLEEYFTEFNRNRERKLDKGNTRRRKLKENVITNKGNETTEQNTAKEIMY